jgi:hypothetical protein
MNEGWVKLHRKGLESSIFVNNIYWKVWCWCLLRANHENSTVPIGTVDYPVKSSQFITSRSNGASECHISEQNWKSAMGYLKSTSRITSKSTNKFTIVTILKWNSYQQTNQQTNQQVTSSQPASNQQVTTDNNDKNDKNDKKEINPHSKIDFLLNIPLKELQGISIKLGVNQGFVASKAEDLYNYCKAKGKVYKDYYAFLLNAVKRDKPQGDPNLKEIYEQQKDDPLLKQLRAMHGKG